MMSKQVCKIEPFLKLPNHIPYFKSWDCLKEMVFHLTTFHAIEKKLKKGYNNYWTSMFPINVI
jgi:hypothetical protein